MKRETGEFSNLQWRRPISVVLDSAGVFQIEGQFRGGPPRVLTRQERRRAYSLDTLRAQNQLGHQYLNIVDEQTAMDFIKDWGWPVTDGRYRVQRLIQSAQTLSLIRGMLDAVLEADYYDDDFAFELNPDDDDFDTPRDDLNILNIPDRVWWSFGIDGCSATPLVLGMPHASHLDRFELKELKHEAIYKFSRTRVKDIHVEMTTFIERFFWFAFAGVRRSVIITSDGRGELNETILTPWHAAAISLCQSLTLASLPSKLCDGCGKTFSPSRPNQQYCNESHRQLAYQRRVRIKKQNSTPPPHEDK